MSDTPIYDFVKSYNESGTVRMHMPGHKGQALLGAERLDITEIKGADYLYEAEGIIRRSEEIASGLYGSARTLFSTEGSSFSIKGMLACAKAFLGAGARFAAARNCHRAFLNGCILLDIDPMWIFPGKSSRSVCSSEVTAEDVRRTLEQDPSIRAVYITSPDYFGNMSDIAGIAEVCHRKGAILLVDNAHGAYLKFAGEGLHPLDCGADLCCDSVHKTLPALTGASLLHISKRAPHGLAERAPEEMSLFGSTSPSYVIMQSIERCMLELKNGLSEGIRKFCKEVSAHKARLLSAGFELAGQEPMKITLSAAVKGRSGGELAEHLRKKGIEPEYADRLYVVLMPTPYNRPGDLEAVTSVLEALPDKGAPLLSDDPEISVPKKAMSPREAYFRPFRRIPVEEAVGKVCARTAMSCQPSIPVIAGGEVFDEKIIKILKNYGIFRADVVE
ncbi:Arginine/lysine/ornithine decarboxylase [Ruminococcaceae bacterium FB2012]|nr:Arginine/lysine/ornithine decarboxylase [Ruminococcaceae bacterium FB2012]